MTTVSARSIASPPTFCSLGQSHSLVTHLLPVLLAMVLMVTSVFPVQVLAGQEQVIEGVLHIQNGSEPSEGIRTWHLEEQWRVGGDDDEVFFGVISQVLVDDEGNIYVLDSQLSEVQVYSSQGEYLNTLSREGDGPGEVRNPNDMIFMPNGNLGLVQQFPGKIVQIDREGIPAGNLVPGSADPTAGGFVALADARCVGSNLVLGGLFITQDQAAGVQRRNCYVASFDESCEELVRFAELDYAWEFNNLILDEADILYLWRRWGLSQDGKVLLPTRRNEYYIEVHDPDGKLNRVIEREFTSWKRQGSEPDWAGAILNAIQRQIPIPAQVHSEQTEPDITSIHADNDNNIWVLTSRGTREQPEGIMMTYDVFNPTGHFLKQVQMACEGDGNLDGFFMLRDGRCILVTGFLEALLSQIGGGGTGDDEDDSGEEAAPMEVICYTVR